MYFRVTDGQNMDFDDVFHLYPQLYRNRYFAHGVTFDSDTF